MNAQPSALQHLQQQLVDLETDLENVRIEIRFQSEALEDGWHSQGQRELDAWRQERERLEALRRRFCDQIEAYEQGAAHARRGWPPDVTRPECLHCDHDALAYCDGYEETAAAITQKESAA